MRPNTIKTLLPFFALSLILLLAACNGKDIFKPDDSCDRSSQQNSLSLTDGNEQRDYQLYVPSSYDASTPTPLVINFHGFGGCAGDFKELVGSTYGLHSIADAQNFIVVYPQGLTRSKGGAEWDPGDNGEQSINSNDIYFTEQLINAISNSYNIDASRIYAIGYSNGGMMAYGLACEKPDRIAAVGIMSGIMLPGNCVANESCSVIHFHGVADGVLPLAGNNDFQSVSEVINFWLTRNSIDANSLVSTTHNNGDVLEETYSGGTNNTVVSLYTIYEENNAPGDHVWFSADISGNSPNQLLWDFLYDHQL